MSMWTWAHLILCLNNTWLPTMIWVWSGWTALIITPSLSQSNLLAREPRCFLHRPWRPMSVLYNNHPIYGVFPRWNRNSVNSANLGNLMNLWSIIGANLKVLSPVSCWCCGSILSQTQEVTGLNSFTAMTDIFVPEFAEKLKLLHDLLIFPSLSQQISFLYGYKSKQILYAITGYCDRLHYSLEASYLTWHLILYSRKVQQSAR